MTDRQTKRKQDRMVAKVVKHAKVDMENWLSTLQHNPTTEEALAFKAGYIAGINRNKQNNQ